MPNSFDFDPRGPSNRLLFVVGACFIVVAALTAAAAVAKSKGTFEDLVRVGERIEIFGNHAGFLDGRVPARRPPMASEKRCQTARWSVKARVPRFVSA